MEAVTGLVVATVVSKMVVVISVIAVVEVSEVVAVVVIVVIVNVRVAAAAVVERVFIQHNTFTSI